MTLNEHYILLGYFRTTSGDRTLYGYSYVDIVLLYSSFIDMSGYQAQRINFVEENYYLMQSAKKYSLYFREEKRLLIQYMDTTKSVQSDKGQ